MSGQRRPLGVVSFVGAFFDLILVPRLTFFDWRSGLANLNAEFSLECVRACLMVPAPIIEFQ